MRPHCCNNEHMMRSWQHGFMRLRNATGTSGFSRLDITTRRYGFAPFTRYRWNYVYAPRNSVAWMSVCVRQRSLRGDFFLSSSVRLNVESSSVLYGPCCNCWHHHLCAVYTVPFDNGYTSSRIQVGYDFRSSQLRLSGYRDCHGSHCISIGLSHRSPAPIIIHCRHMWRIRPKLRIVELPLLLR